jgi:diguanylate cyclase (GGDEF)-like protein
MSDYEDRRPPAVNRPAPNSALDRLGSFLWAERYSLMVFFIVGFVGLLCGQRRLPSLAAFIPSFFVISGICNIATAVVLARTRFAADERDAGLVLGCTNAVNATFALTLALIMPISGTAPPVVHAGPHAVSWTYAFWRGSYVLTAMWYVFVRRNAAAVARAPIPIRRLFIGGFLLAAFTCLAIGISGHVLPTLHLSLESTDQAPFREGIAGFIILGIAMVACALAISLPNPTIMDRAVAVAMVAVGGEVFLTILGASANSVTWYSARLLSVFGSAMIVVHVTAELLSNRSQLMDAELKIAATEAESSLRAQQFRAVWQAATTDGLSDNDYVQAIVDLGSANLRPSAKIYGYVSHFENDRLVIEAISCCGRRMTDHHVDDLNVGAAMAFDGAAERELLRAGRTAIGSLSGDARPAWASYLGLPIKMGAVTHFLVFATCDPLEVPFVDSDVAYVEVLGAQILHRYYQLDQVARIRFQLEHDSLTGLVNLTTFRKTLRLSTAKGVGLGVARLNLDGFRDVNASEGHLIGDEILVEVAAMLRGVEATDVVARIGGDDFAIILYDIDSEPALASRLERYRQIFDRPFHTGDRMGTRFLPVTCSIGATVFPRDSCDMDGLLKCADAALETAKKRGGGSVVVYSESERVVANGHIAFRRELRDAIDGNGLVLEYQPTFDLATRAIVGVEALVRWEHPTRGRLMPDQFLAAAERGGLMPNLTRWVLARAIRDFSTVELPKNFRCFINVPVTLLDDPTFVGEIEARIATAPHLARHLGIEITETEAMQNVERTVIALRSIRRRGLQVAIDDFGTGYSSLSYLKRLPIDIVKIDRIFVQGLPDKDKDVAVAELFLDLTRRLEVISLAEGIESVEQVGWLREKGCMRGQGFLVAPSLPIAELRECLAQQASATIEGNEVPSRTRVLQRA